MAKTLVEYIYIYICIDIDWSWEKKENPRYMCIHISTQLKKEKRTNDTLP